MVCPSGLQPLERDHLNSTEMMRISLPAVGTRYGRLVFVGPGSRSSHWVFQCDCGSPQKETWHGPVRKGTVQSCGCLWRETVPGSNTTHGMTNTRIYRLWSMMHDRCRNPRNKRYESYGARGIAVCERWASFETFYADMGDRPEGKTLNRIDNDGPYAPWNCEWGTDKEQARNKRDNKLLTFQGKTQPLAAWAEELGLNYNTLNTRVQRGWSDERVLGTPIRKVSVAWRAS